MPTPVSYFKFMEGTGTTATSETGGYTLVNGSGISWAAGGGINAFTQGIIGTGSPTSWTVAFDMVLTSVVTSGNWKQFMEQPADGSGYWLQHKDGKPEIWRGDPLVASGTTLATGTPQQLVYTVTPTHQCIYLGGSLVAERDIPGIAFNTAAATQVWGNATPTGTLKALRFYDTALTAGEVAALRTTPVSHYDFHEGSGSTASDIMGNWAPLTATTPASAWSGQNAAAQFNLSSVTLSAPWTVHVNAYVPDINAGAGGFNFNYVTDTSGPGFYCYAFCGPSTMNFYTPGTGLINGAANSLRVGEQHLTWTCDGTTVKIYVEGELVGSGAGTGAPTTLTVAKDGSSTWKPGSLIRDIRFFNVALTATEVAALSAPPGTPVAAAFTSAGSLSGTVTASYSRTAALTGVGALSATTAAAQVSPISAALSAVGTLSAGIHEPGNLQAYPDAVFTVKPENITATVIPENRIVTA